jgi:hypothetical protein
MGNSSVKLGIVSIGASSDSSGRAGTTTSVGVGASDEALAVGSTTSGCSEAEGAGT